MWGYKTFYPPYIGSDISRRSFGQNRTEEAAGSNPARSTLKLPVMGDFGYRFRLREYLPPLPWYPGSALLGHRHRGGAERSDAKRSNRSSIVDNPHVH